MSYNAAPLDKLIEEFSKFPGIGTKGATRMAYQVLSMSDEEAAALAGAIQAAHTRLHRCRVCQNYTEAELCPICASAKRDRSVICVVEKPRDVQAFERTREYRGLYHVLHGLMNPLDGITAEQLTVKELLSRLSTDEVKEVIMAMNPTVEGEATAMYLAKLIKPGHQSHPSGLRPARGRQSGVHRREHPVQGAGRPWRAVNPAKVYNSFKNGPCKTAKM